MPKLHSSVEIFFIFDISKFLNLVIRKSAVLWKRVSLKQNRVGMPIFHQRVKTERSSRKLHTIEISGRKWLCKKPVILREKISTLQ